MVKIVRLQNKYHESLIGYLNTDQELREALDITEISDLQMFQNTLNNWQERNHGNNYAILFNDKCIGLISYSKCEYCENSAKIGYWLGSDYWNQGICSIAFEQIIELCKKDGYTVACAKIENNNIASKMIWQKLSATSDNNLIWKLNY